MTAIAALLIWIAMLAVAAWGTERWRDFARRWIPLSMIVILIVSDFWRIAALSRWNGESPPLAEPSAAFLSVWILVLVPLLRQRLDGQIVAISLLSGLVAAAAIGTVMDISHLIAARFGIAVDILGLVVIFAAIAILYLAGFALCLLMVGKQFPWEYPAWFAGWLIMTGSIHPTLSPIHLDADHGIWMVAVAFGVSYCLYWGMQRYGAGRGLE